MHRENRENGSKKFRENTGNLEILPKYTYVICSRREFLDSKDTGYHDICCKIFEFFKVSFADEIVPNCLIGTEKIFS